MQKHFRINKYLLTVQALFVDDSTAGKCFVILLITHQRVHAQNGFSNLERGRKEQNKFSWRLKSGTCSLLMSAGFCYSIKHDFTWPLSTLYDLLNEIYTLYSIHIYTIHKTMLSKRSTHWFTFTCQNISQAEHQMN